MAAAWQTEFQRGVKAYQTADYPQALELLSQAILHGGNSVKVYDSRAAVYEKLGKTKEALKDTKACLELDRTAFQGYVRATRLFLQSRNHVKASTMVSMAFRLVDLSHPKRRSTLEDLEKQVVDMRTTAALLASENQCHISKLPLELLMEILTLSTAKTEQGHTSHLTLASVCSQWSDIIHNRPQFWSTLVLTKFRPCAKVELWMKHAGGRITELNLTETLGLAKCESALDILGSACRDHLSSITIDGSSSLMAFRRRKDILYLPERVTRFEMIMQPEHGTHFSYNALILEANPEPVHFSLQELTFRGFGSEDTVFLARTVVPTLTALTLENSIFTLTHLLEILTIQSSLISLTLIDRAWKERPQSLPKTRHTLTHLRRLSVDAPDILDFICSHFDFANIHTLSLVGPVKPTEFYLRQIVNEQTSKSIECLELKKCHFDGLRLAELLAKLDNLKSLSITHSGSDINAVVERLSSNDPSTPVCPALTHVNVAGCIQLRAEPCVRLIRSRLPSSINDQSAAAGAPAAITSLCIDKCPDLDADLVSWLRSKVPQFSAITIRETKKRK